MKTLASVGSVSHGTMRNEDLIPEFCDLLSELNEQRSLEWQKHFANELAATAEFKRIDDRIAAIEAEANDEEHGEQYFDEEASSYDMDWLFNELEAFAPPYCYFGAHEGDGSDYGFWISHDSLRDAAHDGDLLQVNELSEVPDDYVGEVLHVNDHGNATLYNVSADDKWNEVWAIV